MKEAEPDGQVHSPSHFPLLAHSRRQRVQVCWGHVSECCKCPFFMFWASLIWLFYRQIKTRVIFNDITATVQFAWKIRMDLRPRSRPTLAVAHFRREKHPSEKRQPKFVHFLLLFCCTNIHKQTSRLKYLKAQQHTSNKILNELYVLPALSGTPSHQKEDSLLSPLHRCAKYHLPEQGRFIKETQESQFSALTTSPTSIFQPLKSTTAVAGCRKLPVT